MTEKNERPPPEEAPQIVPAGGDQTDGKIVGHSPGQDQGGEHDLKAHASLLFDHPGRVVELRALGVEGGSGSGVVSGYFDDPRKLIGAALELDGKAKGVYVTLNPVQPVLLTRAPNQTVASPERATCDDEIALRCRLLIDVDPVRAAGNSATEEEKQAASAVASELHLYLEGLGFPPPVKADSGNGAHLIYRVEVPTSDNGLIQRVLQALAFRFDTDAVRVDQSVFNPARISKLYGTLVKKGDYTPDRPHRRSRLLEVPEQLEIVPLALLERVAGQAAPERAAETVHIDLENGFDVDRYLTKHGLAVARTAPWRSGRRWVLERCPFNSEHPDDRAAYVVQLHNGAIAAGCHHNRCVGKRWHDLRDAVEPGWRAHSGPGRDQWVDPDLMKVSLTHRSFGLLVLSRHGKDMRHCGPWSTWLVWDGTRWVEDQVATVQQWATEAQVWLKRLIGDAFESLSKQCAEAQEDPNANNAEHREARRKKLGQLWADVIKYESVPARSNAIVSASWESGIPVLPDGLNRCPLLLNVQNGTLDLNTLELGPHRREHLLTQIVPVGYDRSAACPRFNLFIEEVIPDPEQRAFVQRAFGYSMTGLVTEHNLLFLYGAGNNGKTTLLTAFLDVLGPDYASPAPPKLLVKRTYDEHLTEIADLFGKRLLVCSESGEGAQFDEEKVKLLTGGDRLKGRRMKEDLWAFEPTHTLWLHSNYQPRIQGTDEGIWRRVLQVPFETRPRVVDKKLGLKLPTEAPGILNWGIEGLRAFLDRGLDPPDSVRVATANYRAEQDVVGRFMAECLIPASGHRVRGADMYGHYKRWCESNGERLGTSTWFGKAMGGRLHKTISNGVQYEDVRLVR